MDTNEVKQSICIECKDGPTNERFKATIISGDIDCDVIAKAEQLIRLSSYCAFRKPRDVHVIYRTDAGRVVTGNYSVNAVDMNSRGFLAHFCAELLNSREVAVG